MPKRVKRITIYRTDHPWLAERQAALERLRRRDLVGVARDKSVSVSPGVFAERLDAEEREVVYKLLGYAWDRRYPLIAKRAGMVGGRAAVAGRRLPVWQIVGLERQGYAPAQLMAEFGLSPDELHQALGYARRHREEIEQDILDQERSASLLAEVAAR